MKFRHLSPAVILVGVFASLQTPAALAAGPNPVRSEYFLTKDAGFSFDVKSGALSFNVVLEPLKTLPPSA